MNYLAEKVFQDNKINVLHNQILRLSPDLGISGTVARIIKGDVPDNTEIKNSALVTTSPKSFSLLQTDLEREFQEYLTAINIIHNSIQAIIQGVYIEIWLFPDATFTTINSLKVHSNIPTNIL